MRRLFVLKPSEAVGKPPARLEETTTNRKIFVSEVADAECRNLISSKLSSGAKCAANRGDDMADVGDLAGDLSARPKWPQVST